MAGRIQSRRGTSLTAQLLAVTFVGGLCCSWLLTRVASDQQHERSLRAQHERILGHCESMAGRAAPLLERGDDLRLAVLAASMADLVDARVLMVDASGTVRLDTGLALGGRRLAPETADGAFARSLEGSSYEVLAPALGTDGNAGEVRIRYRVADSGAPFLWSLFGISLLCLLSIAFLAAWVGHHWVGRVRRATDRAYRLARGQAPSTVPNCAVHELQGALDRLSEVTDDNARQVEEGFLEMAGQLLRSLERQGVTPKGHGERSRRYAVMLAERVGLPADLRRDLEIAALLADIGRLGVRRSALRGDHHLSSVERESLRQVPIRGAHLLAGLPTLRGAAAVLRSSQEKYDGNGHPDGLRGQRIPVASRILAIAIAYDLLTCEEGDGPHMSWPDALDKMHEDRGEHFDPMLLDAFEDEIRKAPVPQQRHARVVISASGVLPYKLVDEMTPEERLDLQEDQAELLAMADEELELLGDDAEGRL